MTWLSDYLPQGELVLDASVVINLLGSGDCADLLRGLGHPCLIEQKTLEEVRRHPIPGHNLASVIADLQADGTLQQKRMTDAEYDTFIRLVHAPLGVRLDDGESAAIAIAARGVGLVLDEKRARRRVDADWPGVTVVSSLQLIVSSAHRQSWPEARVKQIVEMARIRSRMGVPKDDAGLLSKILETS